MDKIVLDGNVVAQEIREGLKTRIEKLKKNGLIPCLATVLVGDNPASETYVKMKGNACKRLNMKSIRVQLSKETETAELIETIKELNNDNSVHRIILQHLVQSHIDKIAAIEDKDIIKEV